MNETAIRTRASQLAFRCTRDPRYNAVPWTVRGWQQKISYACRIVKADVRLAAVALDIVERQMGRV